MLEYMRRNANSKLVWLIIGAIALVFVFFGMGGGGGGGPRSMSVNGEEISLPDYQSMVNTVSRMMTEENGGAAPDMAEARKKAVAELVNRLLLLQSGRNLGLTIADETVARQIAQTPQFQTDGRFNNELYKSILKKVPNMTPSQHEREVKEQLAIGRLYGLIQSLALVSQPELLDAYHFAEDQVAVKYAFFPSTKHMNGLSANPDQLAKFYDRNKEFWRLAATMKVEYVEIDPLASFDEMKVAPEELKEVYEGRIEDFIKPERAEVSHILFKFPRLSPNDEEKAATKAKAEAAYQRTKTEDFGTLAEEVSEDQGSSPDGGNLGTLERGRSGPFKKFEDAIFSLPVGETSPPVETEVGYHLIKVANRYAAGPEPLEKVKDELESDLKLVKARQVATAQMEELMHRLDSNPKLAEVAGSMSLEVKTSNNFSATHPPAFFEGNEKEIQAAFSVPVGQFSAPIEGASRLVLYSPVEHTESSIPPIGDVRGTVLDAWLAEESAKLAKADADYFVKRATEKGWETALAEWPKSDKNPEWNAITGQTELFARPNFMATQPFDKVSPLDMLGSIFSIAKPGDISVTPAIGELNGAGGYFVVVMAELNKADESLFADPVQSNALQSMVSEARANAWVMLWHSQIYKASEDRISIPDIYLQ